MGQTTAARREDDLDTPDVDEEGDVIPKANLNLGRNGRKIWDLSFSFLSQEDTFPKYDQLNMLATSTPAESQPDQYTLQGSNEFYTQVVRKTNGGQLPFIFQPDSEENSFAICKFDSKFAFQQTAPGLMSVRCKIREVW